VWPGAVDSWRFAALRSRRDHCQTSKVTGVVQKTEFKKKKGSSMNLEEDSPMREGQSRDPGKPRVDAVRPARNRTLRSGKEFVGKLARARTGRVNLVSRRG